jgi:transcriptional regulator with GAF, ATPase, and Fis domain
MSTEPITPRLVGLAGPFKDSSFPLEQQEFSIGRDPTNELSLADRSVSRRHCVLEKTDNGFLVRDLGSLGGTLVNGTVTSAALLQHGDRIGIGSSAFMYLAKAGESPVPSVELYDQAITDGSTVQLPPEESACQHPETLLGTIPASDQLAHELGTLLSVATRIGSVPDVESLQWQLLGPIFSLIPADRGAILIFGNTPDELSSVAGWDRVSGPGHAVHVSRTVVKRVREERAGLLVKNVGAASEIKPSATLFEAQVQSLLCVPLLVAGEVAGVIYLDSTRFLERFTEHHLKLLTAVAGIAALALQNARRLEALRNENRRLRTEAGLEHGIVGESPAIVAVLQKIGRLASSDANILIYGESGTGKELAARALHRNSRRADQPFIAINCAALTETLLESELFGHEKGAFTGATGPKPGQFEVASGGTVFLDEIGELAPALQAKLLRVLQEREFYRVGGTKPIHVDIRVIAATNKDLAAEVAAGRYRQDLYYRLNVVSFVMPALRDRKSDIPMLAQHLVGRYSRKCQRAVKGISPQALACMTSYSWPGNVRELENAIERAVILGGDDWILPEDLPETVLETPMPVPDSGKSTGYHEAVLALKKELITKAVEQAKGNYTEAANLLDLHPNYLHRLIRNLDLKSQISE